MMEGKWHKKQIGVSYDCGEISFYGNEEILKQVWINLLNNAVKFSTDGGKEKIEIRHTGNRLLVSFAIQGEPLSDEVAVHIFDKFYQADTARPASVIKTNFSRRRQCSLFAS